MKTAKISRYACLLLLIASFGMVPLSLAAPAKEKTSLEDVKKETKDLIQTLKGYSVEQRDEAMQKIKVTLDDLDKRINVLEKKIDKDWEKMDKTARDKARVSLQELRKERTQVAEWYGSLKSSSVDAWEGMKKVFSEAYQGFNADWEKFEKEYGADK